jgi:hypothetical protein
MAGTGKSTISRTLARSFKERRLLGASFFFKRGEGDRGNASRFFTTIARQLMVHLPEMTPIVLETIRTDASIFAKTLKEQFDKLCLRPLIELGRVYPRSAMVIVVDALDECDRQEDIKIILSLLPQVQASNFCLRFFITSRPELPIRLDFEQISQHEYRDFALQEIPKATIEHDISIYLQDCFARIRREHSLSSSWPGQTKVSALVAMATPLFIFAATVCRFVADHNWDPKERLEKVLEYQTGGFLSKLEGTYLPVLSQLLFTEGGIEKQQLVREFQEIVGSIVVLANPLSTTTLARLLDISQRKINIRLKPLHSVLSIPDDENTPVKLLHLSFGDFLLDPQTREKTPLAVNGKLRHRELLSHCLRIMTRRDGGLERNICRLSSPAASRSGITSEEKDAYLPPELQYACCYWVHHLERAHFRYGDADIIYSFLKEHAIHWLEAMSVLGRMSETVALTNTLYLHMRVRILRY